MELPSRMHPTWKQYKRHNPNAHNQRRTFTPTSKEHIPPRRACFHSQFPSYGHCDKYSFFIRSQRDKHAFQNGESTFTGYGRKYHTNTIYLPYTYTTLLVLTMTYNMHTILTINNNKTYYNNSYNANNITLK